MADLGIDYTAYPYPVPMKVLPALLYSLGREFQALYGRAHTVVTQDWVHDPGSVGVGGTQLQVQSTLGFPYGGATVHAGGWTFTYGAGSLLEDAIVLYTENLADVPAGVLIPAGTRITLDVRP